MNQTVILQLNDYAHSRAILFSHIEHQYAYELYRSADQTFGILFTTFDYHYCFGAVPNDPSEFEQAVLDYHLKHKRSELILFGPTPAWEAFLTTFVTKKQGAIDPRNQYKLNHDVFREFDPFNDKIVLEYLSEPASKIPLVQATVYLHNEKIGFAKALMTGHKLAEIEVWTDKQHRQQGFGFDSSLVLIKHLLDHNINPVWSCWKAKTISNNLALKLGFELEYTFPAFIWIPEKNITSR